MRPPALFRIKRPTGGVPGQGEALHLAAGVTRGCPEPQPEPLLSRAAVFPRPCPGRAEPGGRAAEGRHTQLSPGTHHPPVAAVPAGAGLHPVSHGRVTHGKFLPGPGALRVPGQLSPVLWLSLKY